MIKLSALGDFVLAFPAFERIRQAHSGARIDLLTTPSFAELARASPFFDAVETDGRPASLRTLLALIGRLRRRRFDRIYDLQGNDRTNLLFQALRPFPPEWSGVAHGCGLPHRNPDRMKMHTLERQAQQLEHAGIWPGAPTALGEAAPPDLSWMMRMAAGAPPEALAEARPIALLAPGAAPNRPAKRWPASFYAELAAGLMADGLAVQLVGGPAEAALGKIIEAGAPGLANLIGRTDLAGVAALGSRAALAVGNDTGPIHLVAAAGAPTVVLFSADSDPALCAPRGRVSILREASLAELSVERVLAAARAQMELLRSQGLDRAITLDHIL